MRNTSRYSRRTVLGSIALGAISVSGCSESIGDGGNGESPFAHVSVEGTDLVVELTAEATVDTLNVIQPDGELFAQRQVAAGVRRETFPLGTDYQQGEYEVLGLNDDQQVGVQTLEIRPDVQITDVKLARNHPEEMYEGAGEPSILSELIVSVENVGTGPDSILQLRIEGDVPRPTPEDYPASGIYSVDGGIGNHADEVVVGVPNTAILVSSSRPFSPTGENASCETEPNEGQFTVYISTKLREEDRSMTFKVTYAGEDLFNCNITIEEL